MTDELMYALEDELERNGETIASLELNTPEIDNVQGLASGVEALEWEPFVEGADYQVFPPDERRRIPNTTVRPFRYICKLESIYVHPRTGPAEVGQLHRHVDRSGQSVYSRALRLQARLWLCQTCARHSRQKRPGTHTSTRTLRSLFCGAVKRPP